MYVINYATSPLAALAATATGPGPRSGFVNPNAIFKTRELLSALVGKGFTDTSGTDARSLYANIAGLHGEEVARKLMMHAILFNQRPDMRNKTPEQRIQSFYEMGSADPVTQNILTRSAQMGSGPVADSRNSWNALNQDITGRTTASATIPNTKSPDVLKKAAAMLK